MKTRNNTIDPLLFLNQSFFFFFIVHFSNLSLGARPRGCGSCAGHRLHQRCLGFVHLLDKPKFVAFRRGVRKLLRRVHTQFFRRGVTKLKNFLPRLPQAQQSTRVELNLVEIGIKSPLGGFGPFFQLISVTANVRLFNSSIKPNGWSRPSSYKFASNPTTNESHKDSCLGSYDSILISAHEHKNGFFDHFLDRHGRPENF
jgi:hypothetical protein